ncbi:MAG: amidohydrolase [Desulfobacula sp.]|uniref:amidohydrolase n=1 Tax=Desulfobacula sp. TaxID=2593537 RepID=UPI0025C712CF|nr:amidohydrolase family protein [Desulfobacula sp.]MCD4721310.1 amidohydrolase [Desulfobacula sp.]
MSSQEFAIYSSNIFTGIPRQLWAEAVGIKNGCIAVVGTNQEVKSALPNAKAVELPGRLVSPGLVDAHCHFVSYARAQLMIDLTGLPSIEGCRNIIKEAVSKAKPGQWLIGRGWNHHLWKENRVPAKEDLDDISPDNPLLMIRVCGHSEWLNSKALQLAGITPESPDPPGARFDRDAGGELTGLLHEARDLIMEIIPPVGDDELKTTVHAAQSELLSLGLTGVHTCESLEEWKLLREMDQNNQLKLRVHHLIQSYDLNEADGLNLSWGKGNQQLWIGHLKLFADGSLGSTTALMHESYEGDPDNYGIHCLDADELKHYVLEAYKRGLSVAIHAIGDKAGTNALDAIANGRKQYPGLWRDRIEHVQLYKSEDLARYRDMGIVASVQPIFVPSDWHVADKLWGNKRCSTRAYAWKTLMENDIQLQFGSDAPIEQIRPILGLQAAVLRQTSDLKPEGGWQPQQRLTLEESLAGFTRTAAWTSQKEDYSGSLLPGNWADLTVFEKDLTVTPAREWHNVDVEMTIINGEIVYRK